MLNPYENGTFPLASNQYTTYSTQKLSKVQGYESYTCHVSLIW